MKKVLVLLALVSQVAIGSDIDLYRGLLFWIKDQKNIEGNELRQTSLPLSTVLDGSKAITFSGASMSKRDTSAFSFAMSFKVGSLDCINRLFQLGRTSRHFYFDDKNVMHFDYSNYARSVGWKIEKVNTWYTIVVSHNAGNNSSGQLNIFIGEKDSELTRVYANSEGAFFNCNNAEGIANSFKLGYTDFPSSGYLQSGQFANIRFWTRALSDEECAMVDKCQNVFRETKPLGCPSNVNYDFFPLGGNMFGVDESSTIPKCSNYNIAAIGWTPCNGRLSITGGALSSGGNGVICITNMNSIFGGDFILNNGVDLSDKYYRRSSKYNIPCGHLIHDYCAGYRHYPYYCTPSKSSSVDVSYSMWLKLNSMPLKNITIFKRQSTNEKFSSGSETIVNSNYVFSLSITANCGLNLEGTAIPTITFPTTINEGEWFHLVVAGKQNALITVYVNGSEVGNVSAPYTTLGYLAPVDGRFFYTEPTRSGFDGEIHDISPVLTIGGWDGEVDELVFYDKTLTASEVKVIYEKGAPPDPNTTITPTTRNFPTGGSGGAIVTSGSADTWWARVTEPWITLSSTSGNIGYPVAYTVSATTNAEQRIGYVYVNGHAHTVTQDGLGGTIDSDGATFESSGGNGVITVGVNNGVAWKALSNVDWLTVSPKNGIGSGSVKYQVASYDEVAIRQGTLTVAGNEFTVFQYGRRMKLDSNSVTKDYQTHVIPITVNALAITEWNVTPNASWISVVDSGNGKGGDLVTIAIAENPSYKARTGTVTIGTEKFTITQQGRPTGALSFSVSPANSTASVEGANGLIAVTATPDLPWTATSGANWLTIYSTTANGAGNGNVVYSASPNPTLSQRTGVITVTPEKASGITAKTHKVTQPAATAALSILSYEFESSGEPCSVEVSCVDIVQWTISESLDWLTVNGSTSRVGPGTVVLQASVNETVYPRSGTVTIAGKTFSVTQKARGVEVEYDSKLFGTDGGMESISIHPDGNSSWTAVASDPTWITIFQGDSGTGDGEIMYIISPYVGDGSARTGWITVGDKKIYITQRAYDLSISPNGKKVTGNNGAGEIGVSASIGDVWNAIVTEPWITIVDGYDSGTGSGTVRFIYTENNTGKTRTGKIIIAGEVYTLEQAARMMVNITATAGRGGKVSGGGSYDLGSEVTLTAIPDDGYKFSYWTGDVSTMQNPIKLTVDVAKSVTAVFEPLPIAFESVTSGSDGVRLSWNNLAWATTYRIYRGVTSVPSSAIVLTEIVNTGNCSYLDESGDVGTTYWYWIEAEGAEDSVMSDPMTGMKQKPIVISPITYQNLRGATHTNPNSYHEGTLVSFSNPSGVTGYTFAGWTPSQITADMTGAQTVRASWTANNYTISYNANGGSGTMDAAPATYDSEVIVAENGFTWTGYVFTGWAVEADGNVVYAPCQPVTNLTAQSGGVVTLYAVWEAEKIENPVITPGDGSIFKTDTCTVAITCATPEAKIYYTTNGRTPSVNDRYLYQGPFTISDTTTVIAFSVKNGKASDYVEATITYVEPEPLTLKGVLDETNLVSVETGGAAEWMPIYDEDVKVGDSLAISGAVEEGDEEEHQSWIRVKVNGKGTLSFWWRVDCEPDPRGKFTWDRGVLTIDGKDIDKKDGITEWMNHSVTFDTAGEHEIVLTYISDGYHPVEEDVYAGCMWADGFVWTPKEEFPALDASATKEMISQVLSGATDAKLSANIKTVAEYSAFRSWVKGLLGTSQDQVKDSPNAWLSYVLDTGSLIEGAVSDERVKVEELAVGGESGIFDMKLRIADVSIGAGATVANLLRVFAVEGTASLADEDFSVEKVAVSFGEPDNGAISLAVTPRQTGNAFFVRTRLRDQLNGDRMNGCEVTFNLNGGGSLPEGMSAKKFVEYASTYGELPVPTRDGYVFDGWYTAAEGGVAVTAKTVVTADMDIYARWDKESIVEWTIEDGVLTGVELNGVTDIVIPDSVKSIGACAFFDCYSLTSVTIPDSVTSIGDSAFECCYSLETVVIGNGVMSIETGAFFDCYSLTSVTIPDSVTSIGDSAFECCSSLTSVTIPDSVTSIGDSAFAYCDSLERVELPGVLKGQVEDGDVFYGCSDNIMVVYVYKDYKDGIQSTYQFDGNLNDSSGNGYHLSGKAGNYVEDQGNTANSAYALDGTKDVLKSSLYLEGDFTVSLWVKLPSEALDNGNCIFFPCHPNWGDGIGSGLGMEVNKGNVKLIEMWFYAEEAFGSILTYDCDLGTEWNHVAVSVKTVYGNYDDYYGCRDGRYTCSLYINGECVKVCDCYGVASFSPIIGGGCIEIPDGGYSGYGKGYLDNMVIYNRTLNDEDIGKVYEDGVISP